MELYIYSQNLIALPARIWRNVLSAPSVLNTDWLNETITTLQIDQNDTW